MREKLVYIAIIIAIALSGTAISYYFMGLLTPSKTAETRTTAITSTVVTVLTPVPATSTTPIVKVRVGYAGPLKIAVFNIIESRYINIIHSYRANESLCLKASPGMKFIVIGIRFENAGSKDISSDELSQYIADIALLTSSGLEYKLTRTYQSPFLSLASQEECLRNNAVPISWESTPFNVLRPGDYREFPALFIIPESDIPVKLQIIKDSIVVTEIDLR